MLVKLKLNKISETVEANYTMSCVELRNMRELHESY